MRGFSIQEVPHRSLYNKNSIQRFFDTCWVLGFRFLTQTGSHHRHHMMTKVRCGSKWVVLQRKVVFSLNIILSELTWWEHQFGSEINCLSCVPIQMTNGWSSAHLTVFEAAEHCYHAYIFHPGQIKVPLIWHNPNPIHRQKRLLHLVEGSVSHTLQNNSVEHCERKKERWF